jgi:hypothetical protein
MGSEVRDGSNIMSIRNAMGAIVLAAALVLPAIASAFDESKYPDMQAQRLNRNRFLSSEQDSVVQFQNEKAVFFGGASNGDEAGAAAGKPSDHGIGGAATLLSRHRTFGREGGSAQAGSRRQVQTILWVRACHSATVLTLSTPRTRNLVSPRLRAWALAHSAVAARSL